MEYEIVECPKCHVKIEVPKDNVEAAKKWLIENCNGQKLRSDSNHIILTIQKQKMIK